MKTLNELPWIAEARAHIGLKEIVGPKHNNTILGWLKSLSAWWSDDETPWCGVFVANCLRKAGRDLPRHWYRAKDYLTYGTTLDNPAYGSIAVLTREGGGHVAFVVGKDKQGNILLLGGNQGNMVSIAKYHPDRIISYRWPSLKGIPQSPLPERYDLAVGSALASSSEA